MCFLFCAALSVRAAEPDLSQLAADARVAQAKQDYLRAAGDYKRMLAEVPDSAELWANEGIMLHLAKHYDEAVIAFRNSLRQNAALFPPNFFLGADLLALGRPREARPYIEKAKSLKPTEPVVLVVAARDHMALGDALGANALYREACDLDRSNASAWFGLGATYFALMRETLRRLNALPDTAEKRAFITDKPSGQALTETEAAGILKNDPQNAAALYWYARAMRDDATQALAHAGAIEPDSARTHHILGEIYLEQGDFDRARTEFRAWAEAEPNSTGAKLALAVVNEADGHLDAAFTSAAEVLKEQPANREAAFIAADVLVRQAKYEPALPYAQEAAKGNAPAGACALLAKIYEHSGDTNSAIRELEKAAPADQDGSYHFRLYRLYEKAGRKQDAAAALRTYRDLKASAPAQPFLFGERMQALLQ